MKRAKQHVPRVLQGSTMPVIAPRNLMATNPLLAKGGAHSRRDKRAKRALQKEQVRRELKHDV